MTDASPLDFRRLVADIAAAIEAHTGELNALDAAVGDGDHGTTLARGFARAAEAVAAAAAVPSAAAATGAVSTAAASDVASDPGRIFQIAGRVLLTMGGASGPLFATIFMEAGRAAAGAGDPLSPTVIAQMLAAAADGVQSRGGTARGDKTLYDALDPAAAAAREAAASGQDAAAVIAAAAAAARAGAESTRSMVARQGRARFVGERSAGHIDPGAAAIALILETIAQRCSPNTA